MLLFRETSNTRTRHIKLNLLNLLKKITVKPQILPPKEKNFKPLNLRKRVMCGGEPAKTKAKGIIEGNAL